MYHKSPVLTKDLNKVVWPRSDGWWMTSNTCTTTAESSGRDARTEAKYLLNVLAFRFLRMRDVL